MSDLLALLSLGSAGIGAQNTGVAVATNNVANANTEGYSRQRISLDSLVGAPLVGGVRAGTPERFHDQLLGSRLRSSSGALAMSRAFHDAVLDVEQRLAAGGSAIHEQLGTVFGELGRAAATPVDAVQRTAVVAAVRELVAGIHRRSAELAAAREEVNQRIRERADEASELAAKLAETNLAIARSSDPTLRDERDRTATALAELVGGSTQIAGDGQLRFVLDGGGVLVDGDRASTLAATLDPTTGDARIDLVDGGLRRDVSTAIGSGKIAADLAVRDGTLTTARDELDQLAFDIATQFNNVHSANAGLDGVAGRPLFTPPAAVSGAARTIDLDPTIAGDPSKLALAQAGAGPGDNRGALALHGLADAKVTTAGTSLAQSAIDLVAKVGSEARRAGRTAERDQLVNQHLGGLRDALAGVDVQEELTSLARFEHASAAMTRFVSTIDGLLGDLIDRL